jgi:hypothetical protein
MEMPSGVRTCSSPLPGDEAAAVELTYNWDPEPYDTCNAFIARGVTINRPPRDGRMAFVNVVHGICEMSEIPAAGKAERPGRFSTR